MKAIVITRPGGPEVLQLREVPTPQPFADQVLVRNRAAGVNRADIGQRTGHYPAPPGSPTDIPGLEFAGEVRGIGPQVRLWREGDRVFGITGGGAYAEFVVAQERTLVSVPANLSWAEAASIPEVFITAHDALWKQAALQPSETVLIHAVGSGVGLAAVQLTRAMAAIPYGTSRSRDKIERAREYGLQDGVQVSRSLEELQAAVEEWTSGAGCDVILDLVGGPYFSASLQALSLHGRLILISTAGGSKVEIDLRPLMSRRLIARGTVLRARPLEEKILAARAFAKEVVPLFTRGILRATIDAQFSLAEAAAAHARLESNETFGKLVLIIE